MSHAEFSAFIAPSNEAGKLLQSHFAALQLLMTPITLSKQAGGREQRNETGPGAGTTTKWLANMFVFPSPRAYISPHSQLIDDIGRRHRRIRPEMRIFYEWPLSIERGVSEGRVPLCFASASAEC